MKIKIFNINYLFENDHRYAIGYLQENPGLTYEEEIAYINDYREIEITFDELIENGDIESPEEWYQMSDSDINDLLVEYVTDITGLVFVDYEYKLLED